MKLAPSTVFAGVAGVVVAAAVVAAIAIVGSPNEARLQRLDKERVGIVQSVSGAIGLYKRAHRALPRSLEELAADTSHGAIGIRDPESGAPIEYRKTGADTYELCVRFAAEDKEEGDSAWNHGPGRQCFKFVAREN